ncbi:pyrroloquinoline quinone biosynthesis protein PqqE [Spongiactinospora sp. TRM90649]|uniref:pyrroloquinoline quinone biosynthesis protein PqqE n=1 Tax=Spongiactinospora sp. TRM90649 TaxID=3031114 RepID=UPI0023F67438|nr:pyrroloquinoline quinone biosynthesis protein PqqE [Spongiactinospora sp. TRM90649]MDF5758092.1 pyrroloquinoline quinone biosynthesis protein PqqE [Spongiactinospora sp. TRM90649]
MSEVAAPWAMLAELTHACPLHCAYCSNPVELIARERELTTAQWERAMAEAAALGVVHAHLSGGEPLLRPDLAAIVAAAARSGIYTQLVTSGAGLRPARMADLVAAGLHSVQLSVQDATPDASDRIAGGRWFAAKERAAALVREAGLPLGLNVVLHRHNLGAVGEIIDLGVRWGAERIELANTQFYGWAMRNRDDLMPGREQVSRAEEIVRERRERLSGRVELVWVVPDYFDGVAKPCMGGWGAISLTIAPDGRVLPCPGAYVLPGLDFPDVREHPLRWIWEESAAFNAYRGTAWMGGPCAGCPRREEDFGGCRCQAYAITGDAARTDPACSLSPDHHLITGIASAGGPGRTAVVADRRMPGDT